MQRIRETVGNAIGRVLAPGVALISSARRARMFHPDGQTFRARVEPIPVADAALAGLGELLSGHALARFSGALWRRGFEHLDVLGIALRFRRESRIDADAHPEDQDLLLATIVSPFTMPFAPFTTTTDDFTRNRYWAVSPFDAPGVGRVKFRVSPASPEFLIGPPTLLREERLRSAVAAGLSVWHIEVRRTFTTSWTAVARLSLESVADIDQAKLRFSPFHSGRGIVPRGLVHAMRRRTYVASQAARPADSLDGGKKAAVGRRVDTFVN